MGSSGRRDESTHFYELVLGHICSVFQCWLPSQKSEVEDNIETLQICPFGIVVYSLDGVSYILM